ncbi:MAG TPA: biopolymer transporter ExbD [Polyangiaceae bacterium]|jgi:biopolymer transport protein ExbD
MGFSAGSGRGVKSEINVTPLVDVVLVLLIIFMVVTPMLQRGKNVELPRSRHADDESKRGDPLVVSVTPGGKLYVESTAVEVAQLEPTLAAELAAKPVRKVMLKGDRSLRVGDVRPVFLRLEGAGGRDVALAVEQVKP